MRVTLSKASQIRISTLKNNQKNSKESKQGQRPSYVQKH